MQICCLIGSFRCRPVAALIAPAAVAVVAVAAIDRKMVTAGHNRYCHDFSTLPFRGILCMVVYRICRGVMVPLTWLIHHTRLT